MLWYENFDLETIVTPVDADEFERLLKESKYDQSKIDFVISGFQQGFPLHYEGPREIKRKSPNLKFHIGNKTELWNKLMKEVAVKRIAGPFENIPYDNFVQSPIGLVPKDGGHKTRLIFRLSYPKNGVSINSSIPKDKCTIRYPDFQEVVRLCLETGKCCKMGKSDMASAFRHLPMKKQDWAYLLIKAEHPKNGKIYYFVDKCLPFGSSISCAHFQAVSDAIAHKRKTINYLDDFFFAALYKYLCDQQMDKFLEVCKRIRFPVAMEKTFWGSSVMTFLGLLLDADRQIVCLPHERIVKATELIDYFLNPRNKKVTVLQIQQWCGYLIFLCKCIVPSRAFTMKLYNVISGENFGKTPSKQHHHVKIKEENRLDLLVWKKFLANPGVLCIPFTQLGELPADVLNMYSDASGKIGFGDLCQNSWMAGLWEKTFLDEEEPSIEYLELFAVTAGIITWIRRFANRKIILFCDNISVVHMVNNTAAKCKNCMILLRLITLEAMLRNVHISARYVNMKDNGLLDALSRNDFTRFWKLGKHMERQQTEIRHELWPIWKVWLKN